MTFAAMTDVPVEDRTVLLSDSGVDYIHYCLLLAERVGFEPTVGGNPTHALQACLLDHSSTSPRRGWDSNPRSDIIGDRFSRAAP
jgi:hypothetical protein